MAASGENEEIMNWLKRLFDLGSEYREIKREYDELISKETAWTEEEVNRAVELHAQLSDYQLMVARSLCRYL